MTSVVAVRASEAASFLVILLTYVVAKAFT